MRLLLATHLIFWAATPVTSQTPGAQIAAAPKQNLAEFEGHYAYRDGLTLFMVTSDERLMAIIDGSKYLLRPAGTDTFLNPAGFNPIRP